MSWQNIPDDISKYQAFCYIIINNHTNKRYIGYKTYWKTIRMAPLKGRSAKDKKRIAYQQSKNKTPRVNKRLKKVETDWRTYQSSCEALKDDMKALGEGAFTKKILISCRTKMEAQYEELRLQIEHQVLLSDNWYNEQVRARFNGFILRRAMQNNILKTENQEKNEED